MLATMTVAMWSRAFTDFIFVILDVTCAVFVIAWWLLHLKLCYHGVFCWHRWIKELSIKYGFHLLQGFCLCHLWIFLLSSFPSLSSLNSIFVISGCCSCHLWMQSFSSLDAVFFTSFSTFLFHWMLSLDAIFGRYLEDCHPLITFPPGQFLIRRVRRGSAWTKEEARSHHQR